VMRIAPALAPVKVAVLPLSKKLSEPARALHSELSRYVNAFYDEAGNIGRRYRRQDEIGTPYCVTFDFDSLEDGQVTVRNRDDMSQDRVSAEGLGAWIRDRVGVAL
jgi:glycyl-tRNA synthetase